MSSSAAVRRELIWRALAVVILATTCVYAVTRHSWVVAGLTGVFTVVTLVSLALGLIARRRGLLG